MFRFIQVKGLKRDKNLKRSSQNPSQFTAFDGDSLNACLLKLLNQADHCKAELVLVLLGLGIRLGLS